MMNNEEITIETIIKWFAEDCIRIAVECEEEGYPSHGSNYELRCESAWNSYEQNYPWLFEEEEVDYSEEES